jgi:hypothetical protein
VLRQSIYRLMKHPRWYQRRMTVDNSMSITPLSANKSPGMRFRRKSIVGGKLPTLRPPLRYNQHSKDNFYYYEPHYKVLPENGNRTLNS